MSDKNGLKKRGRNLDPTGGKIRGRGEAYNGF